MGFGGEQGDLSSLKTRGAYLSARYESRREVDDYNVLNYLLGRTELNPAEDAEGMRGDGRNLEQVVRNLQLSELLDMPVSNLSNGQTRRAKIARALLGKPEVLLLDEPFMGLDPPTLTMLSPLLQDLAVTNAPRLVLTLRPQDPIPDWITHLIFLQGKCRIAFSGRKEEVIQALRDRALYNWHGKAKSNHYTPVPPLHEIGRKLTHEGIFESKTSSKEKLSVRDNQPGESLLPDRKEVGFKPKDNTAALSEPLVEMSGVRVTYSNKTVLGNWESNLEGESKKGLWWTVRRGQRWGIFGPNGSGKTTLLSLICSDHPQTYSLPIKLFGRSRLPEPGLRGISIFDIQARIGHSSPEIHHYMPRRLTLRQTLENAWAETFRGIPQLGDAENAAVDACLRWFELELRPGVPSGQDSAARNLAWASEVIFGELPFSAQRVALFLRAVIKKPDLVILDEAFSGMDETVRDKCMLFLAHGESKTYSYSANGSDQLPKRIIVESDVSRAGNVQIEGLDLEQALLCISHVREEIPGCVREWICLPEANGKSAARFGRLSVPIEEDRTKWADIWGINVPQNDT